MACIACSPSATAPDGSILAVGSSCCALYNLVRILSEGPAARPLRGWRWTRTQGCAAGGAWILIRRSLSEPSKRADYRLWGPAQTLLAGLVRRAGQRWRSNAGLEEAKGAVGLDQYEVRTWTGWYGHVTLALLAPAVLVVLRAQAEQGWVKATREIPGARWH
jgi:hypothetical protein